ncbi:tegument protein UL51 [Wood mouse herpesvirus]|uniref:Tegument protein UL51 n=1 Tax=Wood mouse herpesvirus TaxID=432370 RepID=D0U1P4_9GAMA|nr:tegument protein UL51 [Wood mouse herpesvirus]ACY41125.1 tegument protein UL51 [Wood mouse herpesvirus]
MSCCGIWPFGKPGVPYKRLVDVETDERMEMEIKLGMPPGVLAADLIRSTKDKQVLEQLYLLAVQANNLTEHINRFTLGEIPEECKNVTKSQLDKLKSVQHIIWNTMISLAAGAISVDEATLPALLDKRAEETVALLEMEKIATAVKLDETASWATDIAGIVTSQPLATPPSESPDHKSQKNATQLSNTVY